MKSYSLIDIPTPYAPTTQWREFLAQMRQLPQDDPSVKWAIEEAEKELASPRRQAEG